MGRTADRLLKLMYEWIKEAEECSSNLRALARELESLREDCNAWETVGNTAAVLGSVVSLCAAPFTGGASVVLFGGVVGGIGAGVSVVTKITEQFKSSSKLERIKEIDKRCNRIADEIEELFKELRDQCPSRSTQERDRHVVNEFLKAMSKRDGLDTDVKDLDDLIKHLMNNSLVKTIAKRLASSLITDVLEVLSVFSLKLEGALLSAAAKTGGKQIGKAVAIRGASRFLGGIVGLAFSLPEAIDNWEKAIKDNHETEASKSLRDTAKKIDEAAENLSDKLSHITEMMKESVKKYQSRPRPQPSPDPPSDDDRESSSDDDSSSSSSDDNSSSSSSEEEELELQIALVNSRSANKFIRNDRSDSRLTNLIRDNNLDVLMITETWLTLDHRRAGDFRRALPSNYNFVSQPRFGQRGGGVAIAFNSNFIVRHVPYHLDVCFEYVAASLRRSEPDEPVLLLNIYRPPSVPLRQFLEELHTLLSWAFFTFRAVVIGGDFNIHVDRPNSSESRDFQALLDDFGLVQRVPVGRATHRRGHTLDLVITRPDVGVTDLSVEPNSFSDHHTVRFLTRVTLHNNSGVLQLVRAIGSMALSVVNTKRKKKSKGKKRRRRE